MLTIKSNKQINLPNARREDSGLSTVGVLMRVPPRGLPVCEDGLHCAHTLLRPMFHTLPVFHCAQPCVKNVLEINKWTKIIFFFF